VAKEKVVKTETNVAEIEAETIVKGTGSYTPPAGAEDEPVVIRPDVASGGQ